MSKSKLLYIFFLVFSPTILDAQLCGTIICRDTIVCINIVPFELKLCTPPGGHYSGKGVISYSEKTFSPDDAGPGADTLIYFTENGDTCHLIITVLNIPDNAGSITGSHHACHGDVIKYSIAELKSADHYEWVFTGGSLPGSNTDSSFIKILFTDNFLSGWLKGRGVNNCAAGKFSDSIFINVYPVPVPSIKNLSDTNSTEDNICKNQRLSYYVYDEFDSCKWTVSGGTIDGYDTLRKITVKWDTISGYGELSVTVFKSGCNATSLRNVTINEGLAPNPATIWLFGNNMLVCSDSTPIFYQWYLEGQVIQGQNKRYYLADTADKSNYYVETCFDACCNFSSPFSFVQNGLDKILVTKMNVTPNPAQDNIQIKFSSTINPNGRVIIYNQYGVLVKMKCITSGDFQIDVSMLRGGLYFIEYMSVSGGVFTSKMVKL